MVGIRAQGTPRELNRRLIWSKFGGSSSVPRGAIDCTASMDPSTPHALTRSARAQDVPAAARLAASLVRQHHAFDPARFMLVEPVEEGYARFLRTQIDRDGVVFLVAELDGEIVGYLLGGLEGRDWMLLLDACGKIHDVYVDAAARGRGIGARLVEEAVSRLVAMGAPRVVLSTAWPNEVARGLFAKLGFRPTMVEMTREAGPPSPPD